LKGNLCSIYQSRPLICRIDDAYDVFFKEKMTLEEYYKLNKEACENLNNQKK
jgi:Fe-S-cluster containining protein